MTRLRSLLVLVVLGLSTASARASAEEPTPDQRARAQQLFESAVADVERENFEAACPKFRTSHEVDPQASAILNLAQCYEKVGKTASAWAAYKEAIVLARKSERDDWVAQAEARVAALAPVLVTLTIVVPKDAVVEGLEIRRDGVVVPPGEWSEALPVDPGEHAIAASAPKREDWFRNVVTLNGEASVVITVPPLSEVRPPTPAPLVAPYRPRGPKPVFWNTQRTTGLIVAGTGAATLVVSAVLAAAASSRYDQARSECVAGVGHCPTGAVSRADGAFDLAAASTVTFVAGGLVLAGGGVIFLAASDDTKKNWFAVSPAGGPGHAGLNARGTW